MESCDFGKMFEYNDQFKKLSVQKRNYLRLLNDNMKDESSALDYCMMLMRHGPNTFTQFIDILIETKQNDIVNLLLNTT